jgi:hypothetical protein
MTTAHYSLSDYMAIQMGTYSISDENAPMTYTLSEDVLAIVQKLAAKLGATMTTQTTSSSTSKSSGRGGRGFHSKTDSWVTAREFKPTVIEKKEGIEKIMNDLRGALNKISTANYDTNSDLIVKYLQEIKEMPDASEEEIEKIAKNIFDIASTNKFFSEIYANLYKKLTVHFPEIFTSILDKLIQGFTETMKTIVYVDQNANYDEFCKYNKDNDKRKAISVFITNLVKMDVLQLSSVMFIINEIFDILNGYMKAPNRINEVEEITENIFLLCTSNSIILKEASIELKPLVTKFANMKAKELPSISSRAIFKYMDLLEKMNKV